MDVHPARELFNELASSLENVETQQVALLQFLKDKGVVADDELGTYLTQAGNAASVRWRAARLRLEHFLSAAEQEEQQTQEERRSKAEQSHAQDSESENKPSEASPEQRPRSKEQKTEREEAQPEEAKKEPNGPH